MKFKFNDESRPCANPKCDNMFVTKDPRQKFCNEQCRYDYNNANARIKMMPYKELAYGHMENDLILADLYERGEKVVSVKILEALKFNLSLEVDILYYQHLDCLLKLYGNYALSIHDVNRMEYLITKFK